MTVNKIGFNGIKKIALSIDDKGNNNNIIDTDSEISLFAKELEKAGFKDARKFITDYNSNPLEYESAFAMNTETSKDSDKNAVISFLNQNSQLRGRNGIKSEVDNIIKDIKDSVEFSFFSVWGTDDEKLKDTVSKINKDNVLQILNTEYKKDETLIGAIIDDVDQDDMDKYGTIIIKALVEKADEFGIDITDIISMDENEKFIVGSDVDGVDYGKSATDKKHVEKIINALNERIKSELSVLSGKTNASKSDKQKDGSMFLTFAKQADAKGDKSGALNGNEIGYFKKLCAGAGIFVNDMLKAMKSKDENTFTAEEKSLKMVLSTNFAEIAEVERNTKNAAAAVASGIKNKDNEIVSSVINSDNINADNVEEFLASLENNKNFMGLATGMKVSGYQPAGIGGATPIYENEYSDKIDIGKKLTKAFGNNARKYTEVIISALYSKAEKENIDVSDIVTVSNDKFLTGSNIGKANEDALDSRYVNDVINKLRERINEYK